MIEYPDIDIKLIDFGKDDSVTIQKLNDELSTKKHFPVVAWRKNDYYTQIIAQKELQETHELVSFENDKTYIVTGGLGDIGYTLCQWLIEHNASHLILLGKTPLENNTLKSTRFGFLKSQAKHVNYYQTDVSDFNTLKKRIDEIKNNSPPIKGIFHLAGSIHPIELREMTLEQFLLVFNSKALSAWLLHLLTKEISLDYFVMFSSISAITGSRLAGHYAAANAFIDGLVTFRNTVGLPGQSINWGPWLNAGMAKQLYNKNSANTLFSKHDLLDHKTALTAFHEILNLDISQIAFVSENYMDYLLNFIPRKYSLLSSREEGNKNKTGVSSIDYTEFMTLTPQEKIETLDKHLKKIVASVLKIQQTKIHENTNLFTLGLDSLMAFECRNKIQDLLGNKLSIAPNFLFEHTHLGSIRQHILNTIDKGHIKTTMERPYTATSKNTLNSWITQLNSPSKPRCRLFCFPPAGMGASSFTTWLESIPNDIEVLSINLPGRERLYQEKPLDHFDTIIDTLYHQLLDYQNIPFFFFGHSLGGALAYCATSKLEKEKCIPPETIFVSAIEPLNSTRMSLLSKEMQPILSQPDNELIEYFESLYGRFPFEDNQKNTFMKNFNVNALRNDLRSITNYKNNASLLKTPIIAIHAKEDKRIRFHEMQAWKEMTSAPFMLYQVRGNHYSINTHHDDYIKILFEYIGSKKPHS